MCVIKAIWFKNGNRICIDIKIVFSSFNSVLGSLKTEKMMEMISTKHKTI